MPRRLLSLLLYRLDRSPLPTADPVRLELEREVLELLVEAERCERAPVSGVVAIVSA